MRSIQQTRRRVRQAAQATQAYQAYRAYRGLAGLIAVCLGVVVAVDLMMGALIHQAFPEVSMPLACLVFGGVLGLYGGLLEVAHRAHRAHRAYVKRAGKDGDRR